jgi:hypothetical protein
MIRGAYSITVEQQLGPVHDRFARQYGKCQHGSGDKCHTCPQGRSKILAYQEEQDEHSGCQLDRGGEPDQDTTPAPGRPEAVESDQCHQDHVDLPVAQRRADRITACGKQLHANGHEPGQDKALLPAAQRHQETEHDREQQQRRDHREDEETRAGGQQRRGNETEDGERRIRERQESATARGRQHTVRITTPQPCQCAKPVNLEIQAVQHFQADDQPECDQFGQPDENQRAPPQCLAQKSSPPS